MHYVSIHSVSMHSVHHAVPYMSHHAAPLTPRSFFSGASGWAYMRIPYASSMSTTNTTTVPGSTRRHKHHPWGHASCGCSGQRDQIGHEFTIQPTP